MAQVGYQLAHSVDNLQIGFLVVPPNVVGLADPAVPGSRIKSCGMIFDIQPVANLRAAPVYRERIAENSLDGYMRNEFFGELKRAVVV